MLSTLPFTIAALRKAYADGITPESVIAEAFRRLDHAKDPGILIHEAREAALEEARVLGNPDSRPLWGIPYVVKDNIDVSGMPTTAACPDFAYEAETDAFVVALLRAAGAICLGKSNLDQFATGLVGVRTPYPVPRNAIDAEIVPGGSSSGSAVAVARGIAAFSLGTDTAGSGRVPAALNSIVGLKPSLGALSSTGTIPACRSLDTISIFAHTVEDAWEVYEQAMRADDADAYSRSFAQQSLTAPEPGLRIAVPNAATLETFGDVQQTEHFQTIVDALKASGLFVAQIDFSPFYDVANLLYTGPWVAERTAALGERITQSAETLHPVTREIISSGLKMTAVDTFNGNYRLKALKRICEETIKGFDLLCVPTIPTFVSVDDITVDPIGPNSRLGTYTNFVNLLDMCGIAIPTGNRSDGRPGSVTILGRAGDDHRSAALATVLTSGRMGSTDWKRPTTKLQVPELAPSEIAIAVCGAHMSGLPLNHELTSRGARFVRATLTAPEYRFYALAGGPPFRPGLVRDPGSEAASIAVEIWALPLNEFGRFMAGIPSPLCIGNVRLEDGSTAKGFLCEAHAISTAEEITLLGGWRKFMVTQAA